MKALYADTARGWLHVRTRGNVVRLPAPQELTFAPAFTVSRAANACSSGSRVLQQLGFATVARVARGVVLAGCGAFGVGYSVLLSAGAMQPHMRSSSNFSCTGRAEARR